MKFAYGAHRLNWRFRRHCVRFIVASAGAIPLAGVINAQMPLAAPTTVTQQVFRSRWVGPQADLPPAAAFAKPAQQQEPDASSDEPTAEDLGISPFVDISMPLRHGITAGPVKVHPALSLGWEYSDQTYSGQATSESDTSSLFAAPSLGLDYDRSVGPWSVTASYGGGIRYYFNPNYTAAGTGGQRNPISQTGSLRVGHRGVRHKLNFEAHVSYGTGYEINTGGNLTQTNINTLLDYEYILTSHSNVGVNASLSTSLNSNGENNSNNSSGNGNVSTFTGNAYWDWLWTGKTKLRFSLGAGDSSQSLQGSQSVNRTYVQSLVSVNYKPKGKFTFDAGLGVGYVQDPGVQSSQYTGVRAIYTLKAAYQLTQKTSFLGSIGLQGSDIKPNFRLEVLWQPRLNTSFSAAIYQDEGFSLTTAEQVQVSRGIIGTVTQRLFSKVDISLSAGWQQTENLSLSDTGEAEAQNGQTYSYGFASADVRWKIRDWLSWQASLWSSSGGSNNTSGNGNSPETRATVSLNLTL